MPEIIDAIKQTSYGIDHWCLLLDEMPTFLFERQGKYLFAECDGFSRCYEYETPGPNWQAFGGAKFDIPMKDGSVEHAHGQWWDRSPLGMKERQPRTSVGIATREMLNKCYVFVAGVIETEKLEEWLGNNSPATDYYKYK